MSGTRSTRYRSALIVAAVSAVTLAPSPARAQDIKATVGIETSGQAPMSMGYTTTDAGVRIDLAQPQAMSIVWLGGPPQKMLMIPGSGQCMEMGEQAFQMMQQMMQSSSQASGPAFNADNISFEQTGDTATIGTWSAASVTVTNATEGQVGTIWLAPDLDTGLFELFARLGEALEAMQLPLFGGSASLSQYQEVWDQADLPEGGVVQMNMSDASGTMSITLQTLEEGSFGSALDPPAGGCQQMPTIGFPE